MTRKILILGSLLFSTVAGPTVSPASADPNPPSENGQYVQLVHDICDYVVGNDLYPGFTYGACMSFELVPATALATHVCQAMRLGNLGTLEENGFTSYNDCVRNFQF